jgi:tryptophan 7-halogenase
MRNMAIPARLQQKMELFAQSGGIFHDNNDIFRDASWLQVMLGQGISPQDYHPAAKVQSNEALLDMMQKVLAAKQQPLDSMLAHDEFLRRYTGN